MPRQSSILQSPHKQEIDKLLNHGYRVSQVLKHFKDKGIILSRSSLYRYKISYFNYDRQRDSQLFEVLYITGNSNLVRSLKKTIKVYRNRKKCLCDNPLPQDLHRRGRLYLHNLCNGWVCYNIAVHLKNKDRKPKSKYHFVSASARSY